MEHLGAVGHPDVEAPSDLYEGGKDKVLITGCFFSLSEFGLLNAQKDFDIKVKKS